MTGQYIVYRAITDGMVSLVTSYSNDVYLRKQHFFMWPIAVNINQRPFGNGVRLRNLQKYGFLIADPARILFRCILLVSHLNEKTSLVFR